MQEKELEKEKLVVAEEDDGADFDALVERNLGERYELIERIGSGGMGAVYKVRNKALDKIFAVKILNPNLLHDRASKKRFEQEAEAASKLTHASSVAVYEYGTGDSGAPFIVMDYLDGVSLEKIIQDEGFLDAPRALDIFIQAAEAVEHAHMKGLVHRDIKPGNVMVTKENGFDLVKLVDFGIAKVINAQNTKQGLTQTGEIFGSPQYMSPEQCQGEQLDGRADIYSLGCVMYESITGKPAFSGVNPVQTILKHINDDAKSFASVMGDTSRVPAGLEDVVMHCLEKDREQRYQTVGDLLRDLKAVRDGKKIHVKRAKVKKPSVFSPTFLIVCGAAMTVSILGFVGVAYYVVNSTGGGAGSPGPSPLHLTGDSISDAQQLDSRSYYYFSKGEYDKAIPMLEFGIKTYKENGTRLGRGGEDTYLADNYQHIGKCYLKLGEFQKAAENYHTALGYYKKWGNYRGGMMPEAVNDYAEVLRKLGRADEAQKMQDDFAKNALTNIP